MSTQRLLTVIAPIFSTFFSALGLSATGQELPIWNYSPSREIGRVGSPVEFEDISDLAVAPDGSIFVADSRAQSIIALSSSDWALSRVIGRQGAGPGEFQSIRRLGLRGDTLYAFDGVLRRLTLFLADGRLAETHGPVPLPSGSPIPEAPPQAKLADGALLALGLPVESSLGARAVLYRFSDGLASPIASLHWGEASRRIRAQTFGATFKQPVEEISLWGMAPDGETLVIMDRPLPTTPRKSPSLTFLGTRGDTIGQVRFSSTPVPIPASLAEREIRQIAEDYAQSFRNLSISPRLLYEAFVDAMMVPEFQSPFDRLVIGNDGTLWLREGAFGKQRGRWRVLTPNGDPLGVVYIATDHELLRAERTRFWVAARGEFDEPVLIQYDRRSEDPGGI